MNKDQYVKIAISFGATGIALGAIGAHLLKGNTFITELQLESFKTGVRYQMFHAIMILILTLNNEKFDRKVKK